MFEEVQNQVDETKAEVKEYFKLQTDLIKLQLVNALAKLASLALKMMVLGGLLFMILFFGTIAFASWIDAVTGMQGLGFATMALFFCLIFAALWTMRKRLIDKPVIQTLIAIIFHSRP